MNFKKIFHQSISLLIENTKSLGHLSIFHLVNIISPIIILPILIRNIETQILAKIFFYQAIYSFLSVFVNFGFNQHGINILSKTSDKRNISKYFFQLSFLKILLLIILLISIEVFSFLIKLEDNNKLLLRLCSWVLIFDIVVFEWFYQSIEKFANINYINFIFRITNLVLIFFLLKEDSSFYYAPLIYNISVSLILVVNIFFVSRHLIKVTIKEIINLKELRNHLLESFPFFLSNFSSKIYLGLSKIILGKFSLPSEIIKFEIVDKVLTLLKIPNTILNQRFFSMSNKKILNKTYLTKLKSVGIIFNIPGPVTILLFGHFILNFLSSKSIEETNILSYLILLPLIIFLGQFYGLHQLIPNGKRIIFSKNINIGVLIYLTLIFLGIWFNIIETAYIIFSIYLTEISISILMYNSNKNNV